jgi:hypothetical protein
MRLMRVVVPAALILSLAAPAFAQEWIEYYSRADSFLINFPKQPTVTTVDYKTEFDMILPAHVHTSVDGASKYSVTMIDYSNIKELHATRLKGCDKYPDQCTNPSDGELRGAIDYAASKYIMGPGKVTYFAYAASDRVTGKRIQLTNPDKTRTFVAIYMIRNRLYIFDGTVPPNGPPPALFQQSVGFLDEQGVRIRFSQPYINGYPEPTREPGSGRLQGCE